MIQVIILWILVFVLFTLARLKRRKARILPSFVLTAAVTFFALLSPYGKVLIAFGSFKITSGSLILGLRRSGVLAGMVFLSQIMISPKIKLPGKPGEFLKQVFYWLEKLTEVRIKFKPEHIIETLDDRLCEIWNQEES